MAAGAAAAAAAMAGAGPLEDEEDDQDDEDELYNYEMRIQRLDYSKYTGMRRFQVRLWLLFEDASSSKAAAAIEVVLLVLIVISTALILVKSYHECYWVEDQFATPLKRCVITTDSAPAGGCTRVCDKADDFVLSYFVIESVCIGAFTLEFLCRLFASPATVGLRAFCSPFSANMIDLLAIVPYYIEISFLVSSGSSGSGANALALLRIVRLTRVLRIVKKSKSLSGLLVLLRTLLKSFVAVLMIVTFAILTCIVCSSLMHTIATDEKGKWTAYPEPAVCEAPSGRCDRGMYRRDDKSTSYFANMGEVWWWCLQTLTSEGYGVPWVPISLLGKLIGVIAALLGTIVLALPIAVIGMHFDDEWSRNRKEQKFEAVSRVVRYNTATQNGTQPFKLEVRKSNTLVGGALNRVHLEPKADENLSNQAYNVQADLSLLIEEHFLNLRKQADNTLDLQRDKLTR